MKYAFLVLSIIVCLIITLIIYLKKTTNTEKNSTNDNIPKINTNPSFEVTLVDHRKGQLNIYKSKINDYLTLKKSKDNKIKVYNNSKYIGSLSTKDYKKIELIEKHPNYFEGRITSFLPQDNTLKKVNVAVQAKEKYSQKIFKLNNTYLNSLVSIKSIFKINQTILTNYGACRIEEIMDDHLIVNVKNIGKREIYDIHSIKIKKR